MADATVEISTRRDGTVVIRLRGVLGADDADELRRTFVNTIRRTRPLRLVIDLNDVAELDSINLGSLAATCELGDDHHVAVFLDHPPTTIAEQLIAAGVPQHRLRNVTAGPTSPATAHGQGAVANES